MDPNAEHLSLPKKRVRRHFSVSEKEAILNTYETYHRNHADSIKIEKVNFTAEAMGIAVSSVYKILREYQNEHELKPAKVYRRKKYVLDNIDMETKNSVRRIIQSFFIKNEPPTVKAILEAIKEREDIPDFKNGTFRKLLRELGFRYTRVSGSSMLEYKWEGATFTSQTSSLQASTSSTNTLPISEEDIKIEIEEEKLFDPSSREYIEYPNTAKKARIEDDNTNVPTICSIKQEIEGAAQDLVEAIEVKKEPGDDEPDVGHYLPVAQIKMEIGDKFVE